MRFSHKKILFIKTNKPLVGEEKSWTVRTKFMASSLIKIISLTTLVFFLVFQSNVTLMPHLDDREGYGFSIRRQ